MPRLPALLPVGAALALSAFAGGCQPACDQLCVENATYIDNCLEYWEAVWPDVGYEGPDEYNAACQSRYDAAMSLSDVRTQRELRLACADDLQLVARSAACNDYMPNDVELDPTEGDNGAGP